MTLKQKFLSLGIFLDNEYLDFYCSLITNNLQTKFQKNITEKHHIIQRAYYKNLGIAIDNSKENQRIATSFGHKIVWVVFVLSFMWLNVFSQLLAFNTISIKGDVLTTFLIDLAILSF